MSTNTEPTTHANREFNEYEVLWHDTSGYGSRYHRTTVRHFQKPGYEIAAKLVEEKEDVNAEDVRVDAVTEEEN